MKDDTGAMGKGFLFVRPPNRKIRFRDDELSDEDQQRGSGSRCYCSNTRLEPVQASLPPLTGSLTYDRGVVHRWFEQSSSVQACPPLILWWRRCWRKHQGMVCVLPVRCTSAKLVDRKGKEVPSDLNLS